MTSRTSAPPGGCGVGAPRAAAGRAPGAAARPAGRLAPARAALLAAPLLAAPPASVGVTLGAASGATLATAAIGATLAMPTPASAQQPARPQAAVAGVVVAEASGRPLPDAQIQVEGTSNGAATDAAGRFRIGGLTGTQVRLVVRRIGFRPTTITARVGDQAVRVALAERATELSQVVVTGTAGVAEKRAIGNAVSQVNVADVVQTQPVRNVADLLTGRAAGVSVVGSTGQVGSGARIRVRGASSLSLDNNPLIYVDGVRVDNTQASGPQNQSFGSSSISRFNDFSPDDIESIEVIKGPAAATLYGTEASVGVVNIITKRGTQGRTTWNAVTRLGANWLPDWQDRFFTNWGAVPRAGGGLDTTTISVRQLNDSLNARFGNDIFRTGATRNVAASVRGGGTALNYFLSANHDDQEGVEIANGLRRTGYRANLQATPLRSVDISSSLGYTTGRTTLPYESGGGGATWATYFASPGFLYGGIANGASRPGTAAGNSQLGFRSGPPNVYYQAYNLFQDVDRFTGSVQLTNRPAGWLDHRLIVGLDQVSEDNQSQTPRNDFLFANYAAFSGSGGTDSTAGGITIATRGVRSLSFDYALNARYRLPVLSGWEGVSSVGGQYYGRRITARQMSGAGFPAAGLISLANTTVQRLDQDDVFENNTLGGFVQQQLIWNDRLFLTGAVRRDDNSSFGTNYPAVTYPKISASYVLSEEPALRIPKDVINSLRLRAAYGGAGQQPAAFAAARAYGATGGVLTPINAGNRNLGPEQSYETELGLDAGFLDDRLGLETTFFTGRTTDAILARQAAPSNGFPGEQLFNAGRVNRRGLEWLVRATPVRRQSFGLDLTLTGSVVRYEIASLANGASSISLSPQIQHVVGYAPGAWWDRRVVSGTYDPVTRTVPNASLRCDDGKGGTVACYTGNTLTAPRVFLGNSVPTREGSFQAGVTALRHFRLNAFVDYRGGYSKLDGNRRVRCNLFSLCEENYYPDRFASDPVRLAEAQRGTAFTYTLIQDASFVRFRELSLTYTVPPRFTQRARVGGASLTVAGRNLGLWTNYGGVEPEASFNGGTRGGQFGQWEQNVLPQTRQFVTTINLTF